MGMFDNVEYKYDCVQCGKPLDDFQSKDGPCELETIKPEQVLEFYASCKHCKKWHEFEVVTRQIEIRLRKLDKNGYRIEE